MNIGEAVKERILELCSERNITINKLGTMSGVTQSTINNIVSGRNNSTTIATIKKLCDGLDITVVEFLHQMFSIIWNKKSNRDLRRVTRYGNPSFYLASLSRSRLRCHCSNSFMTVS